jgi:hypothetical protein
MLFPPICFMFFQGDYMLIMNVTPFFFRYLLKSKLLLKLFLYQNLVFNLSKK